MSIKSVLLISYYFAPQNAIGAVRPTKLAKYLTRLGYEVTVLCAVPIESLRDPLLQRDLDSMTAVYMVEENSLFRIWKTRGVQPESPKVLESRARLPEKGTTSKPAQANTSTQPSTRSSCAKAKPAANWKRTLLNTIYLFLHYRADANFARAGIRKLYELGKHYDVVLSTYGPWSTHTIACKAKQAGIAERWIADFRDEVTVPFRWQKRRLKRYIRNVRQNADAITAVSDGFLQTMGLDAFGQVVPNGYDLEDLDALSPPVPDAKTLSFAYCGQLQAGRDLYPVFNAVWELIREGVCDARRIRFHYAGRQGIMFKAQAAKYGLGSAVTDHGMLTRLDSLSLQRSADALLVAIFNNSARKGVLTGKLMEYLMAGRPVFCCVNGKIPGSSARELIDQVGVGYCYEQANAAADAPKLKAYIRALYEARFSGSPTPFAPNPKALARYEYTQLAEQFSALIQSV